MEGVLYYPAVSQVIFWFAALFLFFLRREVFGALHCFTLFTYFLHIDVFLHSFILFHFFFSLILFALVHLPGNQFGTSAHSTFFLFCNFFVICKIVLLGRA